MIASFPIKQAVHPVRLAINRLSRRFFKSEKHIASLAKGASSEKVP